MPQVGEGVQFQWRHQSGGGDSWQNDLAQLSGGQRSLVAITLLVAVRTLHNLLICYMFAACPFA